jgi:VRR-NUC domain
MTERDHCGHSDVTCLNQHELIRKYRCNTCGGVMMCGCDEKFGRSFLPHQLNEGCELETQQRVAVTQGFVAGTCSECRGQPADPAPAAAIPGRTSKIKRYYWRELYFAECFAQAEWDDQHLDASDEERGAVHAEIGKQVLADIKQLHATTPKYAFTELSQSLVIERYGVKIDELSADYAPRGGKGAQILLDGETVSPEAFARRHYEEAGWSVLEVESLPFHALFGVMMWLLIQDPYDPLNRIVGFGDRAVYETTREKLMVWTPIPEDFGTKGYSQRRAVAIEEHLALLVPDRDEMLWTFDYWRSMSVELRQYLWAHREKDVDRARQLVETLPPETIVEILRYLVGDYWARFVGWPDLLLYRSGEFRFVEVKSSSDKLSDEQKRWIADNHDLLHLPFCVAKIHRGQGASKG